MGFIKRIKQTREQKREALAYKKRAEASLIQTRMMAERKKRLEEVKNQPKSTDPKRIQMENRWKSAVIKGKAMIRATPKRLSGNASSSEREKRNNERMQWAFKISNMYQEAFKDAGGDVLAESYRNELNKPFYDEFDISLEEA